MLALFTKASFADATVLVFGTVLNSVLGLVFYILAARNLGPEGFGYLSFLTGLAILAAEVGDMGFSQAIIRFGQKGDLPAVLKLVFVQRLLVSALYFVLAWLFKAEFIVCAAIATGFVFLSAVTQALLAQKSFLTSTLVNISGNLVRLVITVWLIVTGSATIVNLAGSFLIGVVFSFCLGLSVLWSRKVLTFSVGEVFDHWPKIRRFSPWLGGSQIIASAAAKSDIPLLFWLAGPHVVGIYSSAAKLTSLYPQVATALENVFSPRFSAGGAVDQEKREYYLLAGLFVTGVLAVSFLAPWIVPFIFGPSYQSAIPVFIGLSLAAVPFILSGPAMALLVYRRGQSHKHFVISLSSTIILLGGYLFLVPSFGVFGIVAAAFLANSLILILAMIFNED